MIILDHNDLFKYSYEEKIDDDLDKIIIMDNFFKFPEEIVEYLDINPPGIWRGNEVDQYFSHNGTKFLDRRHFIFGDPVDDLFSSLSKFLKVPSAIDKLQSNYTKFYDKEFNDYRNNYWCPHKDYGLTVLIYLNNFDTAGTNLYYYKGNDPAFEYPEHTKPWREKKYYQLVKTIPAKYNRLVVFNGKKYFHGMAINDNTFFSIERKNLVLFFKDK